MRSSRPAWWFGSPHIDPDNYWQFELASLAGGTRMVFGQRINSATWTNVHNWPADPPEHPAGETNPWRPVRSAAGTAASSIWACSWTAARG